MTSTPISTSASSHRGHRLLRRLTGAAALLAAILVQFAAMVLVFWRWLAQDAFTDIHRGFQPAWLLVVLIPEFLFAATLMLIRMRSGERLTRSHWLIAVAVLLIAGLLFPITASVTGYDIVNAFPR